MNARFFEKGEDLVCCAIWLMCQASGCHLQCVRPDYAGRNVHHFSQSARAAEVDSTDRCLAKARPFKFGAYNSYFLKLCRKQIGRAEIGIANIRGLKQRVIEICTYEVRTAEVGPTEVRIGNIGVREVRASQNGATKVDAQVHPADVFISEHSEVAGEIEIVQVRAAHIAPEAWGDTRVPCSFQCLYDLTTRWRCSVTGPMTSWGHPLLLFSYSYDAQRRRLSRRSAQLRIWWLCTGVANFRSSAGCGRRESR